MSINYMVFLNIIFDMKYLQILIVYNAYNTIHISVMCEYYISSKHVFYHLASVLDYIVDEKNIK